MRHQLHVVVVGAGAAGSAAAVALRRPTTGTGAGAGAGAVAVTVIGAEGRLPYNRTTVNKGLLSGAVDDDGIALPAMTDAGVHWWTGSVAQSLDIDQRQLTLRDGTRLRADAIVLATGATPRPLPAAVEDDARARVLTLRTAEDTRRLRALTAATGGRCRVVVAGAGLIGTEVTAVLREMGADVTLVDPSPEPMEPRVGRTVAAWVTAAHRAAGVDLHLGTRIGAVRSDGHGVLVDLSDGHSVRAAAVVACLGVDPATAWLASSGLPARNAADRGNRGAGGIGVDAGQRLAGTHGIYAAGDLAAVPGPDQEPMRVEHWGAAMEQGRIAAASVLTDLGVRTANPTSSAPPSRAVPSYSTYVHSTKLTILGWPGATATERPVLGAPGDPRFALALLDVTDRVIGAVGIGGAKAANALKPLIARRAAASELDPDQDPPPPPPPPSPATDQDASSTRYPDTAAPGR